MYYTLDVQLSVPVLVFLKSLDINVLVKGMVWEDLFCFNKSGLSLFLHEKDLSKLKKPGHDTSAT